ncbi:MAG: carboxypeptidase-like regulatory domain-containing protein, partial [Bacteroidetes bacterium]|nr:carboxypeptidase-like regulatory domain-containing protein [Bacteroidota bacterium]
MKNFLVFILFIVNCNIFAQDPETKISGIVTGEEDKPIIGANVVIEGTIDGATTDEKGYFEFETKKIGQHNLIITAIDYTESIMNIEIEEGVEQYLNIKLKKGEIKTEEILVTASSFTSGSNS